jgi:chemotaxis protein CheY-P-specific phosphatase CheC
MNTQISPLSPIQAELLRQILNDGNTQVGPTLEMVLGQTPEDLHIKTTMVKLSEVKERIPNEPAVSVRIGFEGDINGQFLLLQPLSVYAGTRNVLKALVSGQAGGGHDAADFMRDEWIQANRAEVDLTDERVRDVLGELGNVLFGNYLTAIYNRCSLATFQELPEVRNPDEERKFLREALDHYSQVAERAFVVEANCTMGEENVHFWLVMMAEPEGFKSMLEHLAD